ncbi:RSP_7527 family protein [Rhodovulum sp. 12E13]|nr:hypothetical protein [Rhodovulum sp. 12E13]
MTTKDGQLDYIAIEQRARQMRAEALAEGFSALRRWLSGRPATEGRTA